MIREYRHPLTTILEPIFADISSSDLKTSEGGISKLQSLIDEEGDTRFHKTHQLNLHSKALSSFLHEALERLFTISHSRRAGVRAVEALLFVDYCDVTVKTPFFSRILLSAAVDISPLSQAAIAVWGVLLSNDCAILGPVIDEHLTAVEKSLEDKSSAKRYIACLILKQLVERASCTVITVVESIIRVLFLPLGDNDENVRNAAGVALTHCLNLLLKKDSKDGVFNEVLEFALENFAKPSFHHSGWLTFNSVLDVLYNIGQSTVTIDTPKMEKAWNHVVVTLRNLPSSQDIRRELYRALPLMAGYDKLLFLTRVISDVLALSGEIFRGTKVDDKNQLFLLMGKLGQVLREEASVYIESMMKNISDNLVTCKRQKRERCSEAVTCLALLADADIKSVRPHIRSVLNQLFEGQLTAPFAHNIASICITFPELHSSCLDRILVLARRQLQSIPIRSSVSSNTVESQLLEQTFQSLRVLNFKGYSTLNFLSEEVVPRLWDPHQSVRRSAAELCLQLLLSGCYAPGSPCYMDASNVMIHSGARHISFISKIQQHLIAVAVSDSEVEIRLATLEMLVENFDHTLSMQESIRSIFPALNDKHANRVAAVRLLGRLSKRNPAAVFPMLRRIIIQCVTEIEYLTDARALRGSVDEKKLEHATVILGVVVEAAPALVQPYRASLLSASVRRLEGPNSPMVLTALLSCVGKLVEHVDDEDIHFAKTVRPIVVKHFMEGGSTVKKKEALRALCSIVRATRDVSLYDEFPYLLPRLLSSLYGGFKEVWAVRRDVLSLMGVVGAVDPVKVKQVVNIAKERNAMTASFGARAEELPYTVLEAVLGVLQMPSSDEEICSCAIETLVKILSNSIQLSNAISYIPRIFSELNRHIEKEPRLREVFFKQLALLVSFFKHHIRSHLGMIFDLIMNHISSSGHTVLVYIVVLLDEIRGCLNEELKAYLPSLLPLLVYAIHRDSSPSREATIFVLSAFRMLGRLMDSYLHVVLPTIIDLICTTTNSDQLRQDAVRTIADFGKHLPSLTDNAARCVHSLIRVLEEPQPIVKGKTLSHASALQTECCQAIGIISQNLGHDFIKFLPIVRPALAEKFGDSSVEYRSTMDVIYQAVRLGVRHIYADAPFQSRFSKSEDRGDLDLPDEKQRFGKIEAKLGEMNQNGEDEWKQWLWTFAVELLRGSSSPALRVCVTLARRHEPFARLLFHPAFASCFADMKNTRQSVLKHLTTVAENKRVSSEVLQELLNLAEYMERVEDFTRPKYRSCTPHSSGSFMLFGVKFLADLSERCNLHAKAIHYLETQFLDITRVYDKSRIIGQPVALTDDTSAELFNICERTIHLCNVLGQHETANGVLTLIKKKFSMENQIGRAEMYEKLRWWSKSLTAYQYQRRKEPNNTANIVGEMTSMEALGDFPNVLRSFNALTSKRAVASTAALGARAAWLLQSWDDMAIAADLMPKDGYFATTSSFYKAVLAVHNGSKDCQDNIDECRRKLDGQLSGLIAESYGRAYRLIVGLQQLSELEEIFAVKKDPSLLPKFSCLWEKRLLRMCPDPVEWQGVLVNHSIVTTPQSQLSMWIQFVSLCRANGREIIAKEVLKKLLGGYTVQEVIKNHHHTKNPSIVIAALSHMYEMGEKNEALGLLRSYTTKLESISSENALCHQKLGLWLSTANTAYAECEYERDIILDHLRKATEIDPSNGHMWHQWARANHDIVDAIGTGDKSIENYIVCAVQGYVNSIRYLKQLQDVLGFLSLWFSYGGQQEVNVVVVKGIETINVNVWLSVIPQIIARIHTSSRLVNESVQTLLAYIAKCHPQALLYTLNVNDNVHGAAAKVTSDMINRRDSGQLVLDRVVEMHGSRLVNEARMVCQELNRSAVLWSEIWLEEILRANNQWVQDGDIRKVWNTLEPLLVLFDKPNKTPSEETFTVEFGTLLKDSTILLFEALQGSKEMNDAWSRLNTVCKQLERQIKNTTSLVMEFVSPKLVESGRDLSLVVPGQYSGAPVFPRIACFVHDMKVMSSKQHPRRISIIGNDGVQYKFLLKGHEDLRQDERVMQLLGLVNTFLESHRATKGHDCTAKLFSVTPLAENAGLVGWVDNCDTLHAIIEGYRAINGIPISTELSKIKSMTDDHSRLIVVQQQECFEASQEDTDGMDIARHCWCHAPGAEVWLDRRTTYVRTLASMSIVGHILGLGDRHPLNLIMHASTGRVVHIDFGDCFEVAMARSIFPEKVPFRLTRMLVKAMEISGIDGLFRHGCENVMQVLREEQNSVLAMLEAFVHDPLISWRLSEEGHEELYNEGKCHRDTERPGMEAGRSFVQKKDVLVGSVRSVTNISRVVKSLKFDGVDRQLHSYKKARRVIDRVREKLNGKEFMSQQEWPPNGGPLTIPDQVSRLIEEATSSGNLCQHFQGWCAFW